MSGVDTPVSFAVEGRVDAAVVRKIFQESGVTPGTPYICDGIDNLRKSIKGYNIAAKYSPWFVLCDLDRNECAPAFCADLLTERQADGMRLRIAVREVEAWLMADRKTFAKFLGVHQNQVPPIPEQVDDPKHAVVNLARKSANKAVREGLVPSETGGRRVGPAYPVEMVGYIRKQWSPSRASSSAPSLARALELCKTFSRRGAWS